jgi:hypothetical protein
MMEITEYTDQLRELRTQENNADNIVDVQNDTEGIRKKRILIERMIQGNRGNLSINKLINQR